MEEQKWVIFDLDGTLNRTDTFVIDAYRQGQKEFGIQVLDEKTILSTCGQKESDSLPVLAPALNGQERRAFRARVVELYMKSIRQKGMAYDGCLQMLSQLKERGFHNAICSNAMRSYIDEVLETLKLSALIEEIQPIDPDLTKEGTLALLLKRLHADKAVMVGDRSFDFDAAKANHIPFIGCLYGFAPWEVSHADLAVEKPIDIVAAVSRLIG